MAQYKTVVLPANSLTVSEKEMFTLATANKAISPVSARIEEYARQGWSLHSFVTIPATIVRRKSCFEVLLSWIPIIGMIWAGKPDYIYANYNSVIFVKDTHCNPTEVGSQNSEPYSPFYNPTYENASDMGKAYENSSNNNNICDVVLTGYNEVNKLKIIKTIREITGADLAEAKDLAEQLPSVIKQSLPKDEAIQVKMKLEMSGAEVSLEYNFYE